MRLQPAVLALAMACGMLLAGCAGLDRPPADAPGEAIELTEVPFFPQREYQCGPAALATVLSWGGVDTDADRLTPLLYLPAREGTLQAELVAQARRHDRLAYRLSPEPEAILRELAAGHPVLVMQNLGLQWLPAWHYAVVVGYRPAQDTFVLRSGTRERHITRRATFVRTWERGERWGLVVLPAGEIPATAEPRRYLAAAYELEESGRLAAATKAYRAGSERWTADPDLPLALANLQYRQGEPAAALETLQAAQARGATSGPLQHNLARLLAERGQWSAAEAAAEAALASDDRHRERYARTLAEIRCRDQSACQP